MRLPHLFLMAALLATGLPPAHAFKLKFDGAGPAFKSTQSAYAKRVLEHFGSPVHENMLLQSFGCKWEEAQCETGLSGISRATLLRGVRWPDDPSFYVTQSPSGVYPKDCLSTGKNRKIFKLGGAKNVELSAACWILVMGAGQRAAHEVDMSYPLGRKRNSSFTLPLRSHYADLQFLHGMAPHGQPAATTHALIMAWMRLTYGVARGDYAATQKVADVIKSTRELRPLQDYFQPEWSIADLLDFSDPATDDARGIALGALLHTVQDSFAGCHTVREVRNGKWRIKQHLTYYGQMDVTHTSHDTAYTPAKGVDGPVEYGARIVKALRANEPFEVVEPVIEEVFHQEGAIAAAPGESCLPASHPG